MSFGVPIPARNRNFKSETLNTQKGARFRKVVRSRLVNAFPNRPGLLC